MFWPTFNSSGIWTLDPSDSFFNEPMILLDPSFSLVLILFRRSLVWKKVSPKLDQKVFLLHKINGKFSQNLQCIKTFNFNKQIKELFLNLSPQKVEPGRTSPGDIRTEEVLGEGRKIELLVRSQNINLNDESWSWRGEGKGKSGKVLSSEDPPWQNLFSQLRCQLRFSWSTKRKGTGIEKSNLHFWRCFLISWQCLPCCNTSSCPGDSIVLLSTQLLDNRWSSVDMYDTQPLFDLTCFTILLQLWNLVFGPFWHLKFSLSCIS